MSIRFPNIDISDSPKFKYGDKIANIDTILDQTFAFALDYISLNQSNLCFDYKELEAHDYYVLFDFFKEISTIPIGELFDSIQSKSNPYHFHDITLDRDKRKLLLEPLKQLLKLKYIDFNKLPPIS